MSTKFANYISFFLLFIIAQAPLSPSLHFGNDAFASATNPTAAYNELTRKVTDKVTNDLKSLPADIQAEINKMDPAELQKVIQDTTAASLNNATNGLAGDTVNTIKDLAGNGQLATAATNAAKAHLQQAIQGSVNTAVLESVGLSKGAIDSQVQNTYNQLKSQLGSQLSAAQLAAADSYLMGEAQKIVATQTKNLTGVIPAFDNPLPGLTNSALQGASTIFNQDFANTLGITSDALNQLDLGGTLGTLSTQAGTQLFSSVSDGLTAMGFDPSSLNVGEIASIMSDLVPDLAATQLGNIDFGAILQTPQIVNSIAGGLTNAFNNAVGAARGAVGAITGEITGAINGAVNDIASSVSSGLASAASGLGSELASGVGSDFAAAAAEALAGNSDFFPVDFTGVYSDYLQGLIGLSAAEIGLPVLMDYDYTSTAEEDRRYAELCIDNVEDDVNTSMGVGPIELEGTRAGDCIPHKITRLFSALELSPWYLISLQNINGLPGPYLGPVYRGESNRVRYATRILQTQGITLPDQPEPIETTTGTCKTIIKPGVTEQPDDPVMVRKELDSCANQYILTRSDLPRIPNDSLGKKANLLEAANSCQVLNMMPVNGSKEEEYYPDYYYVAAWSKLLNDSEYTVRARMAPKEPYYGALATIADPQPVRDDYGVVTINDLTEYQYERIYDPTHPFSPRWDFLVNEYDEYTPKAPTYLTNKEVYCSGYKTAGIKTDILSWRQLGYNFYLMWRFNFNEICHGSEYCSEYLNCNPDEPCCAVSYDENDRAPAIFCGPPDPQELCAHITKPVVPINVLKMREINENNFPQGVQKGYKFSTYFGINRPYMRCWDTGLECGAESAEIDHDSTVGSNYAIVGAGREGEYCAVGGGLGQTSSVVDGEEDPIMDWMELKLYQMRSSRELRGINCLGMHEKVFKIGSGEEMVLGRVGGNFQIAHGEVGGDGAGERNRLTTMGWPFSWRGYVSSPYENRFPFFPQESAPLETGLDQAVIGDVLIYDEDVVMPGIASQSIDDRENATSAPSGQPWRNPFVGYVTAIGNEKAYNGPPAGGEWIKMLANNHGKLLDVCANTEYWGQGEEFTVYKTALPPFNEGQIKELEDAGQTTTTSCEDPYLSFCVEGDTWTKVKRYYPYNDRRVKSGGP